MPSASCDLECAEDVRLAQLRSWLRAIFGADDFSVTPASADASFRRYFRIARGAQTWIAMDAPPGKEDMSPYIRVAQMLADAGVNAPRVQEHDLENGFLLNTDLGSLTYLAALQSGADPASLYGDAIDALVLIQSGGRGCAPSLPPYDEALLRREMALFTDWFCARHLQLRIRPTQLNALARAFDVLTAAALEQPRVFVHRDYHSRNLMVCEPGRGANPGVLDFQDAVHGPVTYDLVSLLRDCYVAWPAQQVRDWAGLFRARAREHGLDCGADQSEFMRWFDLMGLQRHLKAIGIFARLWHRDGKPGYLNDIPRTLDYVSEASAAHDELHALRSFIDEHVRPALAHAMRRGQDGGLAQ